MPNVITSTILGAGLLAGIAVSAYAQSNNIAALPPGAPAATPPAAAAVSPQYVGPAPGSTWTAQEKQTQAVRPSPQYVGPAPGSTWTAQEKQTGPVAPSAEWIGPRPN